MSILEDLKQAVMDCRHNDVLALTANALDQGQPPENIITDALVPGVRVVGEKFSQGTYFLPELLLAGQSVQAAVNRVEPHLSSDQGHVKGRFLIGTVKGDIHDIGKNIVTMILKCNGWEVEDAGVDVDADTFCRLATEGNFDVVGLSALLTMTMPAMEATVKALKESKTKVMVGGAPLTQEYADRIGADAFGRDAWDAVTKAQALLDA